MSSWETWVAFFRDSIQNQMVNDPELKQSLMKECSTKVAVCNPSDGTILASDPGFAQFKPTDVQKLCRGVGGDEEVYTGISWGNTEKPAGYSIIRIVQLPIKTTQYPTGLSANVLYGRNKAYPEESIFVSNTLSTTVLVLFRMTGANRGLINKSLNFLGGALQDAIELGV